MAIVNQLKTELNELLRQLNPTQRYWFYVKTVDRAFRGLAAYLHTLFADLPPFVDGRCTVGKYQSALEDFVSHHSGEATEYGTLVTGLELMLGRFRAHHLHDGELPVLAMWEVTIADITGKSSGVEDEVYAQICRAREILQGGLNSVDDVRSSTVGNVLDDLVVGSQNERMEALKEYILAPRRCCVCGLVGPNDLTWTAVSFPRHAPSTEDVHLCTACAKDTMEHWHYRRQHPVPTEAKGQTDKRGRR